MAATLVKTCPHCFTGRAAFTLTGEHRFARDAQGNGVWNTLLQCNTCMLPMAVRMVVQNQVEPGKIAGDLCVSPLVLDMRFFPETKHTTDIPDHLPEKVAQAFRQAEKAIKQVDGKDLKLQLGDAAAAMDRRTLEMVTKEQAPEKADATLYERINHLAEAGKLTPALKEWAHSLRVVGNEALHDEDGISDTEAIQAHELTRFILIYLYTLPTQVELAQKLRQKN